MTLTGPPLWYFHRYPPSAWREKVIERIRPDQPELAARMDEGYVYSPLDTMVPFHELHGDPVVKFICARVGRQASKTESQVAALSQSIWLPDDGFGSPLIWVGADQIANTSKIWDRWLAQMDQFPGEIRGRFHHNKNDGTIIIDAGTFQNKWPIQILRKSGENPEKCVGDPTSAQHWDEAQQINDAAILNALPARNSRNGQIFFTGVAELDHAQTTLWQTFNLRGEDPNDLAYATITAPSWAAPWQSLEEVEADRAILGDELWQARYAAQFPTRSGAVFPETYLNRFFSADRPLQYQDPDPTARYGAGLDVADGGDDFTVLQIADRRSRKIVFAKAYPRTDASVQQVLVAEDLHRYQNAPCLMDSTVIGRHWLTELTNLGCRVQGYNFTSQSKAELVEQFRNAIERELIQSPRNEQLRNEMRVYRRSDKRTAAGYYQYGAPKNYHDDWVTAAALCTKQIRAGQAVRTRATKRKSFAYA